MNPQEYGMCQPVYDSEDYSHSEVINKSIVCKKKLPSDPIFNLSDLKFSTLSLIYMKMKNESA